MVSLEILTLLNVAVSNSGSEYLVLFLSYFSVLVYVSVVTKY